MCVHLGRLLRNFAEKRYGRRSGEDIWRHVKDSLGKISGRHVVYYFCIGSEFDCGSFRRSLQRIMRSSWRLSNIDWLLKTISNAIKHFTPLAPVSLCSATSPSSPWRLLRISFPELSACSAVGSQRLFPGGSSQRVCGNTPHDNISIPLSKAMSGAEPLI